VTGRPRPTAADFRRRRMIATLVAIVVVVVIVLGIALAVGGGGGSNRADAPTTLPTTVPPSTTLVPPTVTMFGDSVMLGAADALVQTIGPTRTTVDAAESRQFSAGVDEIQQYRDQNKLGDVVVVQLGTNGTINPDDFNRMMDILKGHKVLLVNAKVPRAWEGEVNQVLADGAKHYKNAVLVDWHDLGDHHPEWFYDDGLHLRPDGAQAYAQLILSKL
jgi:lysophospholipase L1-like esterase